MGNSIIDKIDAEIAAEEAKKEKRDQTVGKAKSIVAYVFVALFLLAEAITLGIQVYNRYVPATQYKEAVALYDAGSEEEALRIFEKLGDLNNSEYYCNMIYSKNPTYRFTGREVGDELTFGKYYFHDITWVVIEVTEKQIVLLSKDIIDAGPFPQTEWFNSFKEKSFTKEEGAMIKKAYILDADDARALVQGKSFAKTQITQNLAETGYSPNAETGYGWWIDEEATSNERRYAAQNGTVGYNTTHYSNTIGIRPAISIKIN
ncbi:MAG: hypothetical protein IKU84_04930 [Clostridia bacterium]|nr:hypothetical protein [Clostridia bacterium]